MNFCRLTIQEPIFSVSNTEFEGGDDGHGYGDCIFLVKQAQPSHTMPSSLYVQRVASKAIPCARGTPGQFGTFGVCHVPDIRGILGGLWQVRTLPVYIQHW